MIVTKMDSKFARKAIASGKATVEEIAFLDTMISFEAAQESVSRDDYSRLQRLTGGSMSTTTPICERP